MVQRLPHGLAELYETDETAWLDITSELIRQGHWERVDAQSLAEYLADMAKRDRREVMSRLTVLIAHLLKWRFQPEERSRSWDGTIERERQELLDILESGTLRNHAGSILEQAYRKGIKLAVAETGLPEATFPASCEWTIDSLLSENLGDE